MVAEFEQAQEARSPPNVGARVRLSYARLSVNFTQETGETNVQETFSQDNDTRNYREFDLPTDSEQYAARMGKACLRKTGKTFFTVKTGTRIG